MALNKQNHKLSGILVFKLSTLIILLFLLAIPLISAESKIISIIETEGNYFINDDLIKSVSKLEIGTYYNPIHAAETIKKLYKLNFFKDVKIFTRLSDDDRMIVTIRVQEYPRVNEIYIDGADEISESSIKDELRVTEDNFLVTKDLMKDLYKIESMYREEGYLLAKAVYELEELSIDEGVNLRYVIDEGNKTVVRSIIITGPVEIDPDDLKDEMETDEEGWFYSGEYKEETYEEDKEKIINYYFTEGYIDARIISDSVHVDEEEGKIDLYINIFEGKKYEIGKIYVEGNSFFSTKEIVRKIELDEGEIFNQEDFDISIQNIVLAYYEEGYIYSKVDHNDVREGDVVNITFLIDEGHPASINKIYISGNTKSKEKIIRRELSIVPGQLYKQSDVVKSQQRLYNLQYFGEDIKFDYRPTNEAGDIDVYIEVEDQQTGTASAGAGYGTENKFTGFLQLGLRNPFGNGHSYNTKLEIGAVTQNIELGFTNPWLFDTPTIFGFDLYHNTIDYTSSNYRVRKVGGSLRLGTRFYPLSFTDVIMAYKIYNKKYSFIDDDEDSIEDASSDLREQVAKGDQITSSTTFSFIRDSRDNYFSTSYGSNTVIEVEYAGGILGGDVSFVKTIFESKWFYPTIWDLTLGVKSRIGWVTGFGGSSIPYDERFYPGGIGSDGIRGYTNNSVGPLRYGYRAGGTVEAIFSAEYKIPISENALYGVLFFDAGNAWENPEDMSLSDLKKGVGFGIRIKTPMGPIGFDMGYGLDRDGAAWEPHIQIGTMF